MSYGTADDLKRITKLKNTTNQIALLKLGKLPLLYKVSTKALTWFRVKHFCVLFDEGAFEIMQRVRECAYVHVCVNV